MSKNMGETVQVIGLGQACVDYLGRLSDYPQENGKVELVDLHMRCGGPASTSLITLSRLGIATSFIGSVSDDLFGKKIVENLKKEKIDISCLKVTPGCATQFAFIAVTRATGNRTVFWHRGNAPQPRKEEIDISTFPNADILHTDGLMIEASIEAAIQAKARGMTVVLDAGTLREGSRELASLVDVMIVSETFASTLVGLDGSHEDALYALQNLGPSQVGITLGEKGSIGINNRGIIRQEVFPVQAVDTTGAGDVYHGAYIYGLLKGWEMGECMRFASAAAAINCCGIGAHSDTLNLRGINALLKKHK